MLYYASTIAGGNTRDERSIIYYCDYIAAFDQKSGFLRLVVLLINVW